jgi:hypothetical protein
MSYRKLVAAVSLGAFAVVGGVAAAPADEAKNGCRGINQARDTEASETPAGEALDRVAQLIDPEGGCQDEEKASDRGGDNGNRP